MCTRSYFFSGIATLETKSQCSKCDVTREDQCDTTAAAYWVHPFCTWSYPWEKVGSSGPHCTRGSHKRQKKTDHLQPHVTTTQVLYWGVSNHNFSLTTVQVLYQGASTFCLGWTIVWVLYQGAPPHHLAQPYLSDRASTAATTGTPERRYSTSIGNSGCATPVPRKHRSLGGSVTLIYNEISLYFKVNLWLF